MPQIDLVVFLGNPGSKYKSTRHNIAWLMADHLSEEFEINWQDKFKGHYAKIFIENKAVNLLKPLTFMNKSGESVQSAVSFFKILPENVLVIHDEIELDFGIIHLQFSGGLKGHNGLKSAALHLNSQSFYRLKMGISRPEKGKASGHVLGQFNKNEQAEFPVIFEAAAAVLKECIRSNPAEVINTVNKKQLVFIP